MSALLPKEDLEHVLAHTRELWHELRGGRIFITGGTGFFGCWLLETFAFANAELCLNARALVLTRDAKKFRVKMPHLATNPALEFIEGDVRDFVFPETKYSHVIHAATTSSASVEPLEMLDTIIAGTRRALDFAVACGAKKFLLTSSGAVYGRQPPDRTHTPETYTGAPDSCDPNSAYGEGKRAAELLSAIYAQRHGLETKIARCFAFVGPHLPLDAHFAIGNFIRDGLAGGPINVKADGTPFRSYLFATDLAIWLWTILFKGRTARVYNVGSEDARTIADWAHLVAQTFGKTPTVNISQKTDPLTPPARYVPATARAREELGLREWIPPADAIAKTAEWHRQK